MSESVEAAVECLVDYAAQTGESPTWSVTEQALYWIDIEQPALHRFDPATHTDQHWMLPSSVGGMALNAAGSHILLGLRDGLYEMRLSDHGIHRLVAPPFEPSLFRFNEAACDPYGRLWLGTMFDPQRPASTLPAEAKRQPWHVYTEEHGLVAKPDFAEIPNGLAWSADGRTMYAAHSQDEVIYAFDYNAPEATFSRRRRFATIDASDGIPDGCAIDEVGGYWSALHGGGRLRRFHADGRFDRDIQLPVSLPTMCAFGGPKLDELYVTSATAKLTAAQRAREPLAGKLLRLRPGISGRPPRLYGAATRA
ncbi:MAG TPA: SMP-30/gluconolactonase/LRE family protein [Steroidobacteraceae bacterium]